MNVSLMKVAYIYIYRHVSYCANPGPGSMYTYRVSLTLANLAKPGYCIQFVCLCVSVCVCVSVCLCVSVCVFLCVRVEVIHGTL